MICLQSQRYMLTVIHASLQKTYNYLPYMWYCSVGVVAEISNTYATYQYILNMYYMCHTCIAHM